MKHNHFEEKMYRVRLIMMGENRHLLNNMTKIGRLILKANENEFKNILPHHDWWAVSNAFAEFIEEEGGIIIRDLFEKPIWVRNANGFVEFDDLVSRFGEQICSDDEQN